MSYTTSAASTIQRWQQQLENASKYPAHKKITAHLGYSAGIAPECSILEPAGQLLLDRLCQTHVNDDAKVLEVGSFTLDNDGKSYLGKLLPEHVIKNICYSDLPITAAKEFLKGAKNYTALDITESLEPPLKDSQDTVILNGVWDMLNLGKLLNAAQAIHDLLRAKGKVIILSDKAIAPTQWIENCEADQIPLALYNAQGSHEGFDIVSLKHLKSIIPSYLGLSSDTNERDWYLCVLKFLELSENQRKSFLNTDLQNRYSFSRFLKRSIPPELSKRIHLQEDYYKRAQEALTQVGLTVLVSKTLQASLIIDHPFPKSIEPDNSFFTTLKGWLGKRWLGMIAPGKAEILYQSRAIIAEKT